MTEPDHLLIAWWEKNIDELDHEIARLSLLCQVRILDPGVIERVIKRDASVCGTPNPIAFAKLHDMLMLYLANRKRSVEELGQVQTGEIEAHVVERLRAHFANLLGKWPPT
jgi:hypothetical protein